MDLSPQGTLLNIVNGANSASLAQAGGTLDELLVMFFAVELLRVVEAMHSAGFIHGDLKIDNCLLRLEDVPGGPTAWSATYNPTGEDGWSYKGITLIDFGRTIDTRLFPSGQQFIADWDTDARDCFELREQRPWTYQTDYFGLAGVIYCLLFGKYIQANSVSTRDGRHKIDTPLKRYWQTEIWDRLFGILLNPCSVREDGSLPLPDELAEVRGQMEAWLQAHCNRTSNTLKGLLKKVQMLCI
jgi:checkpoint serine/threonine-protein kinase